MSSSCLWLFLQHPPFKPQLLLLPPLHSSGKEKKGREKGKKKPFSSLSSSSPPPPSSSIYYMIQLVSHQIKGQGCNQSLWEHVFFFSLSLFTPFPLCLMLHLKVVNDPSFPFCDRDDSGPLNFWTNKVSTATNVSGCNAFFFFFFPRATSSFVREN